MATTKEQMATQIVNKLKDEVQSWLAEKPEMDAETKQLYDKKIKLAEQAKKIFGEDSEEHLEELDKAEALVPVYDAKERKYEVILAMQVALRSDEVGLGNAFILNKNVQKAMSGGSSSTTKHSSSSSSKRLTQAEKDTLLAAYPKSAADAQKVAEIECDLDDETKKKANAALNRDGLIKRVDGTRTWFLNEQGLEAQEQIGVVGSAGSAGSGAGSEEYEEVA